MATKTFVIVGAGLAGAKAAEALRDGGLDGKCRLSGKKNTSPTNVRRCPRTT
jgi:3-phenylpropionate/trans-cinnamate dioxygenase ferredoxin reductase subunit